MAVTGAGGIRLAVREAGRRGALPAVLLHGWAQSSAVWSGLLDTPAMTDGFRLVAADLRGHGDSDAPDGPSAASAGESASAGGYADPDAWAGDVAALLAHAGPGAVLLGWSYGGLVVTDYLRRHGTAGLAGIVLVGAITEIGRDHPGGRIGPVMRAALPAALDEDPAVAVPALLEFTAGLGAGRLPGELVQRLLGAALRVPPRVRAALFRRDVASADVLAAVDVPTLVMHGRRDAVVDPAAGEYAAATIPGATLRWFDDAGHAPFLERPEEFTAELAAFLEKCRAETREVVR
ncbi:alpha/beta fold hydrolase [Gandjariella thermophila]|uniref:Alpha/beta hydrolase n=1 Tax=Gandjariella thermophila TaxID=1931992 RepID=A0A4D4J4D8_9PSEU|nr:alpha/beta hydrolase [Gandjariella thermophila]GDY29489.1 alpha/beta hydrolase [Gandjariella thermophila]